MPTTSRSGSTSPTTGCRTRSCAPATTASGIRPGGGATASGGAASPAAPRRRAARPPAPRRPLEPAEAVERHLARVRRLNAGRARPPVARRVAADRLRRLDLAVPLGRPAGRRRGSGAARPGRAAAEGPLGRPDPRRGPRLRPRAAARPVPRRPPVGAVPRARPGAARPRLGVGDRPAALRPEQRRRPGGDRAPADARPDRPEPVVGRVGAVGGPSGEPARGRAASRPPTTTRSGSRRSSRSATRRPRLPEAVPAIARRSLGRAMHGLVLRHAFKPAELARLLGPWSGVLPAPPSPTRPTAKRA